MKKFTNQDHSAMVKELEALNKKEYSPINSLEPPFIFPLLFSEEIYDSKMDTAPGYRLDISGYAGFARGFKKYSEDQIYFGFSSNFESVASQKKIMI